MPKTGRWRDPTIPKTGWVLVRSYSHPASDCDEKLGPNTCPMCLAQRPIHIEVLRHPDLPSSVYTTEPAHEYASEISAPVALDPEGFHVGCECSGHMQDDVDGTRKRFKEYANERRKELRAARKAAKEAKAQQEQEQIEALRERRKRTQNRNGDSLLSKMPGSVLHKQLEKRRIAKERDDRAARQSRLKEVADVVAEFKDTERMSWGPGTAVYPAKQGYYVLKSYKDYHWIDWQPRSRGDYVRLTPTTKNVSERDQWFNTALTQAYVDDTTVAEALKQITRFKPVTSDQIKARRDRWK